MSRVIGGFSFNNYMDEDDDIEFIGVEIEPSCVTMF